MVLVLLGTHVHERVLLELYREGYRLVVCSDRVDSPLLGCADHVIVADLSCPDVAFTQICQDLTKLALPVGLFWALSEREVELAARLSAHFDVAGPPLSVAPLGRDKFALKEFLRKHGVPLAPYRLCRGTDDLASFVDTCEGGVVLKPMNGGASDGVIKVEGRHQLAAHVAFVRDALEQSAAGVERNYFLAEEYLSGREMSVETISDRQGRHYLLAMTEKFLDEEPFFNEVGYLLPAQLRGDEECAVRDYCTLVLKALELTGVFCHLQLRLQPEPRLLEIDFRPAKSVDLLRLTHGVMPYATLVRVLLGDEFTLPNPEPDCTVLVLFLYMFIPLSGEAVTRVSRTVSAGRGVVEYRVSPGCHACGDNPKHWSHRAGYVTFKGRSRSSCLDAAAELQRRLRPDGVYLGRGSPFGGEML